MANLEGRVTKLERSRIKLEVEAALATLTDEEVIASYLALKAIVDEQPVPAEAREGYEAAERKMISYSSTAMAYWEGEGDDVF